MSSEALETARQLAGVSATLGGLAFTAGAALLTVSAGASESRTLDRPATWTAGAAVASAACLLVAALTWALLAARSPTAGNQLDVFNRVASLTFIAGVFLFFVSLGVSGWIASRRLGIVTGVTYAARTRPVLAASLRRAAARAFIVRSSPSSR